MPSWIRVSMSLAAHWFGCVSLNSEYPILVVFYIKIPNLTRPKHWAAEDIEFQTQGWLSPFQIFVGRILVKTNLILEPLFVVEHLLACRHYWKSHRRLQNLNFQPLQYLNFELIVLTFVELFDDLFWEKKYLLLLNLH